MKCIYCVLLLLCPYVSRAQPLQKKDRLPAIHFKMLNYKNAAANSIDFKGKLLLLDFWASWCGNCLKKMNLLDSMQRARPDDLQVLLINSRNAGESKEKLQQFFKRWRNAHGQPSLLSSAYDDTAATALFPYNNLPHYVWIGPDQRVLTITGPDEVTAENIEAALAGNTSNITGLQWFDADKPMFVNGNAGNGEGLLSRSQFSRYIKGLRPKAIFKKDEQGQYTGFVMLNMPLEDMIKRMYNVLERSDRIIMSEAVRKMLQPGLQVFDNYYCYEIITAAVNRKTLGLLMQNDLHRQFGLRGKWEIRKAPVYLLTVDSLGLLQHRSKKTESINSLSDKENRRLQNGALASLTHWLNNSMTRYVIAKDSIDYPIDIHIPDNVTDEAMLISRLAALGICLTPATENVNQFIIYQTNN